MGNYFSNFMGKYFSNESDKTKEATQHFQQCNTCYMFHHKRGLKFGYPICCIESFATRLSGVEFTKEQLSVAKNNFIPCRYHALLILGNKLTIEDLIIDRLEKEPFGPEIF